jgi:putative flippase GtrA
MKHLFFGKAQSIHIQFMRYFCVGGSAAIVDIFFFTLFFHIWGFHYAIAAFVGYMLGLSWNYIISLIWVFESKHHRAKEMILVFCIAMGGLLWTLLILFLLIDIAHMDGILAKIISQILVLFWNFSMRKFYVFK